jgi:hypothetical protein
MRPFPPSRRYLYMGGTSMATPLTAAAAAVVRQDLRRDLGIANPTTALLKAAMVAGASRISMGPEGTLLSGPQALAGVHRLPPAAADQVPDRAAVCGV